MARNRPRVGPRNPCSPHPYGYAKGVTSVHVTPGSNRGNVRGPGKPKTGRKIFITSGKPASSLCNTKPTACKDMRSTKQDQYDAFQQRKQAIKDRYQQRKKGLKLWGVNVKVA